ncbi:retrovirus-related pol polyprotein from transposon TNT 1-94 [Tanacetum coccineum]
MSTVRLKLVTFMFKKMSTKSHLLLDQWKIPSYCIVHSGSTRQSYLDHSCSYRVVDGLRDVRLIICSHLGSCLEGNEHLSKKHEIWTQKRAKLDSQDLLWSNHPELCHNLIKATMPVIEPCVLVVLKGSFDPVSSFIKRTAELRISEVYVKQPDNFVDPGHLEKVYHLRKSLYGLKRAPRAWSTNLKFSKKFEKLMHNRFEIGLQIHQSPRGIFINKSKYALEILKKHGMDKCDSIGTPMAISPKLEANLSCLDTRKRTFRGIQFLGDKLISWMSKKQDCTTMSITETEYMALSASCAQVLWMRAQFKDYDFGYNKVPLYCDSQSAIAISCNPVQHSHTKHINVRYHFIKEHVENGTVELYFVRTEY